MAPLPDPAAGAADWLRPEGLPAEAGALMASRRGGVSAAPYDSLNLRPPGLRGDALDAPAAVLENQRRFAAAMEGARPVYLDQVHGSRVVTLTAASTAPGLPLERADASVTTEPGIACTVLVADCLPVLLAAPGGRGVGAAHAGWRGLAGGVVEACLASLCERAGCRPADVSAWLGACIGPQRFEVGDEVRAAFGAAGQACFNPLPAPGKWLADLPALARLRLAAAGVERVAGGLWCTASEPSRFFSYRRDGVTGRHAAAIWIRRR
ncbi:MAG TPA: peptidoglycan editing factor PgeF [Ideonella sp.]|nr:peptidoglycan editing factor PgeF [Ideonella sp.]